MLIAAAHSCHWKPASGVGSLLADLNWTVPHCVEAMNDGGKERGLCLTLCIASLIPTLPSAILRRSTAPNCCPPTPMPPFSKSKVQLKEKTKVFSSPVLFLPLPPTPHCPCLQGGVNDIGLMAPATTHTVIRT